MKYLTGFAALITVFFIPASAQTISGTISGTITDPQGAVVSNAKVTAQNVDQKTVTTVATKSDGHYVFPLLVPGNYTITVEASGFKTYQHTGLVLNANSLLTVDTIKLEVGGSTETVEVKSQQQELNSESAAMGDSIVGEQLQNIQVNGQSPLYFLGLTPGVRPTQGNAENSQQYNCCTINGGTGSQVHVTVNGGGNEDTGGNSGWMAPVSNDAVQEVKILTNSYEAEYGRAGGAQINVVTKSGTSQFHGMGFEYFRDRSMNANSWMNNRSDTPRSAYHYNDFGFNIGGPIFFGRFNKLHDKLFFFWDEEWQKQLVPSGQHLLTVPTDAERDGDFSQSHDSSGNPVVIYDPVTHNPYPNNQVPSTSFYGPGQALLKLLPEPNATDAGHPSYNYISQYSTSHPRREDNVRIDYDPNQKWRFYGSFLQAADNEATPYGIWGFSNVPLYTFAYQIPGWHYVLNATTIINANSVNEVSWSQGHDAQTNSTRQGSDDWTMTALGTKLPTFYDPFRDYIPGFSMGGYVGNGPSLSGSLYFYNANTTSEFFDNYSHNLGAHFLKFGFYFLNNWKVQPSGATYDGSYNFSNDTNNPLDSNFAFSNVLLGVYDSFSQANAFTNGYPLYRQIEFYGQDTWKVNRRLTLSYGIRFYWLGPVHNSSGSSIGEFSNFIPSMWDASAAPPLLRPAIVNGQKVAQDPTTGQTYPQSWIGGFLDQNALANGMESLDKNYITDNPGIKPAPRIGFAYDLTGQGSLILHGGGGVFFNRTSTDTYDSLVSNPPSTITSNFNYGYVSDISTGQAIYTPYGPNVWSTKGNLPTTYNWNLGTQTRLPLQMIGDISYVGAIMNHQQQGYALNPVPFGAAFLPENQDPTATNPDALPGTNALPANFMRPYVGRSSFSMQMNSGNTNYNALQASLKRRVATGLFFGASYTWSKCLGTTGIRSVDPENTHLANYTNCGSNIEQDLTINYVYDIGNITHYVGGGFDNTLTREALNHWQLSGVNTFTSGTPYSVGFSVNGVSSQNFTGTPDQGPTLLCPNGKGVVHTGNPYHRLDYHAYQMPGVPSYGIGCKPNSVFGPGLDNWDMSLKKTFPLSERVHLEIVGQAFNVFNHTQFTGINSSIQYSGLTDPVVTNNATSDDGKTVINQNGFGSVNGTASPRVLQLVGKIRF